MDEKNVNEQILNELRLQNRYYRQSYIYVPIIIIITFAAVFFARYLVDKYYSQRDQKEQTITWNMVDNLTNQGKYDEAEKKALSLLQKTSGDYYVHIRMASFYLSKGDIDQAVKHGEIAFQLFPDKSNEEYLKALKKRLEFERAKKTNLPGRQ